MSKSKAASFEDEVARALAELQVPFERSPTIGGLQPDFRVYGPGGTAILIEAKSWSLKRGIITRAANQAKALRQLSGSATAYVVLDAIQRNYPSRGVLSLAGLRALLTPPAGPRPRRAAKRGRPSVPPKRRVFAAMPFDATYDDTYLIAMAYAADEVGGVCERVDKDDFTSSITLEVKSKIRRADAIIVDVSGSNPNVLYEAGYAEALGKPRVFICSTPLDDLPFDIRDVNTLSYAIGQTSSLRVPLARRLRAALRGR